MPSKYNYGMTNLVDRPSSQESELSNAEKRASVPALLAKIGHFHPRVVSFVGKSIFDQIFYVLRDHSRFVSSTETEADEGGGSPSKRKRALAARKAALKAVGARERSGLFPLRLRHANGDVTYLYVQFSTSGLCRDAQVRSSPLAPPGSIDGLH
jgi:TDG/mug DNA glycosylase family protein